MKEAEEYTIKMAEKAQEEQSTQDELKGRYQVRLEFWKQHLQKFNRKSNLFSNISPSKDNWLSAGTGVSGVDLTLLFRELMQERKSICQEVLQKKINLFLINY